MLIVHVSLCDSKNLSKKRKRGLICFSFIDFLGQTTKKGNQFANEDTFQACKGRSPARTFLPFKTYSGLSRKEDNDTSEELPVPGLSLLTPGIKNLRAESGSTRISCSRAVSSSAPNPQPNLRNGQPSQQQTARKQRRCWSPELHRRFVNALQQLGGSQGKQMG